MCVSGGVEWVCGGGVEWVGVGSRVGGCGEVEWVWGEVEWVGVGE